MLQGDEEDTNVKVAGIQINIPAAIVLSVAIAACTALVITHNMTIAVFVAIATQLAQSMTNKVFRIPAERAEDKVVITTEDVQP